MHYKNNLLKIFFYFPRIKTYTLKLLLEDDNEENLMFSTHILFMTPRVFAPLCMRGHNYPMKCERDIREGLGLLFAFVAGGV